MNDLLFCVAVFLSAYFGVKIFREWSLRRKLLDMPNERSSHTMPTPRGGGVIIVAVSLLGYVLLSNFYEANMQTGYLAGAILIAVVSWIDDLYTVSFVYRLIVHSFAALVAIHYLGYFDEIYLPFFQTVNVGSAGMILTFFWIVWLTNAYNFMDGIDGIAGMQALTAGIGWLAAGKLANLPAASLYGGVLAFSSLGFLIHNWQPAKIFMGDVGSAFLGYSFAILPLLAVNDRRENGASPLENGMLLSLGILFVWLFVFDTLYTFARRLLRGEKFWTAHREHAYQKLVIDGRSHQFVTVLYGSISAVTVIIVLFFIKYKGFLH